MCACACNASTVYIEASKWRLFLSGQFDGNENFYQTRPANKLNRNNNDHNEKRINSLKRWPKTRNARHVCTILKLEIYHSIQFNARCMTNITKRWDHQLNSVVCYCALFSKQQILERENTQKKKTYSCFFFVFFTSLVSRSLTHTDTNAHSDTSKTCKFVDITICVCVCRFEFIFASIQLKSRSIHGWNLFFFFFFVLLYAMSTQVTSLISIHTRVVANFFLFFCCCCPSLAIIRFSITRSIRCALRMRTVS